MSKDGKRIAAHGRMARLAHVWATIMQAVALGGSLLMCGGFALVVCAQVADAASAPIPYTGEAAELTSSSATLKGTVYPGNEQTSYYFQYGPTSAYGAQTPTVPAGAGTQTIHLASAVTGLSAYTTYHYRLVAINARGTADGQDRTFTTKKIPLTFTLAATPSRVLPESPFSVDGTLSGTASTNRAVVLQANPFPYLAGFKPVGNPELTNAAGSFSFNVPGLSSNTQLRVATLETPSVNSRAIVELVAVKVDLHVRSTGRRGYVRLYGTIAPAELGALVDFQLLRPGRRPVTVSSTVIIRRTTMLSRFSRIVHIRRAGLYRALVIVASGAQVSNHSRSVLIG